MKKAIIVMFVVTVILTIAALIDEFMTQDTKHGQSRFTSHHPMKINTYKKGQCTYYVFERVKNDGNKINNTWSDIGIKKQLMMDTLLTVTLKKDQYYNLLKGNTVMLHI